ncbi:hypothetical protein K2173_016108 [Erythroxylum novogranatense]|uniref:DUF4283 domain-containing protein n=1 Tax=Erythroxylum novogranatense TaxID=1862640 RepID=A0AAV8SFC3_9ROSI|nr:hypothetical protein K2173_016108 [Erythroxylum novogranatense]
MAAPPPPGAPPDPIPPDPKPALHQHAPSSPDVFSPNHNLTSPMVLDEPPVIVNPFAPNPSSIGKRLRDGSIAPPSSITSRVPDGANPFAFSAGISFRDVALNKCYSPKRTWDEVLDNSFTLSEDMLKPTKHSSQGVYVPVSLTDYETYIKPWTKSLIIKTLGKVIGFKYLNSRLRQVWKLAETFLLVDIGNNFFLVKVKNPDDYYHILTGGPWIVGGQYLTVQRWQPLFNHLTADISSTAVWISLPGLPIEFFNQQTLTDAGKRLGRMVKIDGHTDESSRGKYARICVEIDLTKPLVSEVTIGPITQIVEYEGLDDICFLCGVYGHATARCQYKKKDATAANEIVENCSPRKPIVATRSSFDALEIEDIKNTDDQVETDIGAEIAKTLPPIAPSSKTKDKGKEVALADISNLPKAKTTISNHQAKFLSTKQPTMQNPKPTTYKSKHMPNITPSIPNPKPTYPMQTNLQNPPRKNVTGPNKHHSQLLTFTLGDFMDFKNSPISVETTVPLPTTLNPKTNSVMGKPSKQADPKLGLLSASPNDIDLVIVSKENVISGRPPDLPAPIMDDVMVECESSIGMEHDSKNVMNDEGNDQPSVNIRV